MTAIGFLFFRAKVTRVFVLGLVLALAGVVVLKGGVPEWLAANYPIETKEAPRSAPPEPGSLKG